MCLEVTKLHRLGKVCCFHAFSGEQTKRHKVEATNTLVKQANNLRLHSPAYDQSID